MWDDLRKLLTTSILRSPEGSEGGSDDGSDDANADKSTEGEAPAEGAKDETAEGEKPGGEGSLLGGAPKSEGEGDTATPLDIDKLTLPEGASIPDDAKALLSGMSQEQAQAAVDFHFSQLTSTAETFNAQIEENWKATQTEWRKAIAENLPEGMDMDKATATAAKVIDQFGGDDLREALNLTGFGDHPAAMSLFLQVGKALGEGNIVPAQASAPAASLVERMYPNSPNLHGGKS